MNSRRRFLFVCGTAVGLSGCTTDDTTEEPGTATSPTAAAGSPTTTVGSPTTTADSGAYNAPSWFTDRGDLQHTASVNGSISVPLQERWRRSLGASVRSSPVGGHGNVLVGADDGKLYALNPSDGSIEWAYNAGTAVTTAPTAVARNKGADKFVWVVTEDGAIHSVDPSNGSGEWTVSGGTGTFNSAVNYATGRIFQVYQETGVTSTLRAVDGTTGSVDWTVEVGNISTATPMHGMGNVHVGLAQGGTVYEVFKDSSGSKQWDLRNQTSNAGSRTSGVMQMDVPQGDPAQVITSTENGFVGSYDAGTGSELWSTDLSEFGSVVGLALTQNRSSNVLVVAQRNALYGLNPSDGTVMWTYTHGPQPDRNPQDSDTRRTAQPAIYDDYVFQIVGGSRLDAVSLSSGTVQWSTPIASPTYSSPLVGGNTVYIGDANGDVVAYSP